MLTYAQAEILAALKAGGYIDNEIPFLPLDVFPNRDNVDNGKRRCLSALLKKGLLEKWPASGSGYLRADRAYCDLEWARWRNKNPDVEFWQ